MGMERTEQPDNQRDPPDEVDSKTYSVTAVNLCISSGWMEKKMAGEKPYCSLAAHPWLLCLGKGILPALIPAE